jgi:hypothetical protein
MTANTKVTAEITRNTKYFSIDDFESMAGRDGVATTTNPTVANPKRCPTCSSVQHQERQPSESSFLFTVEFRFLSSMGPDA